MSKSIEERLSAIESRNQKVEEDKAWETSWVRRSGIVVLTYLVVVSYMHFVLHVSPWVNALVPVMGYVLSTLTISMLKQQWQARRNK